MARSHRRTWPSWPAVTSVRPSGLASTLAIQPAWARKAGPVGRQSRVEKTEVKLGQPFDYTIEVRHAATEHYRILEPLL